MRKIYQLASKALKLRQSKIYFSQMLAVCTSIRAYMGAMLLVCLMPLCAKDDDRAPVQCAIWKPTPMIFGMADVKYSVVSLV